MQVSVYVEFRRCLLDRDDRAWPRKMLYSWVIIIVVEQECRPTYTVAYPRIQVCCCLSHKLQVGGDASPHTPRYCTPRLSARET